MRGGAIMFEELFENRNLVASKLKDCIRDKGYTKVSFAKKVQISRPTLDRILNGSINNKRTFDHHLQKILKTLNMSAKDLMLYTPEPSPKISAVYSKNAPTEHEMTEVAHRQYNLLLDIVDLCTIYY